MRKEFFLIASRRVKLLIAALASIVLLSCSTEPKYESFYVYTPPDQIEGKMCLGNCQNIKNNCRRINSLEEDRQQSAVKDCENQAKISYHNCVQGGGTGCLRMECSHLNSSKRYSQDCDAEYNACYQNCGGTVGTDSRCVANCG